VEVALYAKRSSYSLRSWRDANAMLAREGFDDVDRKSVLRAAMKNRRDPIAFAQAAIRLRHHVEAGKPL
jgi:hypothetical protein